MYPKFRNPCLNPSSGGLIRKNASELNFLSLLSKQVVRPNNDCTANKTNELAPAHAAIPQSSRQRRIRFKAWSSCSHGTVNDSVVHSGRFGISLARERTECGTVSPSAACGRKEPAQPANIDHKSRHLAAKRSSEYDTIGKVVGALQFVDHNQIKERWMSGSENRRLREILNKREAVLLPGAANALAARIIEDLGFKAVYVTGAGITNTFLGSPDIGLISMTELVNHVSAMRDAVALPLIVDADTGFGNALNVARTIKALERSGANAIQIEDQEFPKRCGHFFGKSVIDCAEMVQKIHAAVDARDDADLIIIARTDALASHGFEDAIERAAAYIEAGADMTFVEAPKTEDEIAEIPRRLRAPQLINVVSGGLTPTIGLRELEAFGFSMILYANAALQASIAGMQNVLKHLKAHGTLEGVSAQLASFDERQRLVRKLRFDELEQKYS